MNTLMLRRRAMMAAKPLSWISSTGRIYSQDMTIEVSGLISQTLSAWGVMDHLKTLTLTGHYGVVATGTNGQNGTSIWSKLPNLETLILSPSASETSAGSIRFGHYFFDSTNLKKLIIGTPHIVPWGGGLYFRKDMPVPPGTDTTNTGSAVGLELTVYVESFKQRGGFSSAIAPNTAVHEYDYLTGAELFA